MSNVYVIQAEGGPVKIGIAGDPSKRLRSLRTGAPFPLALAHVELMPPDLRAAEVERAAHALLKAAHAHGEWFAVTVDEARAAIREAILSLRAPPDLEFPQTSGRKVVISAWFDPAVRQQLSILATKQKRSQAAMMAEALNLLFEKHGEPPIAKA